MLISATEAKERSKAASDAKSEIAAEIVKDQLLPEINEGILQASAEGVREVKAFIEIESQYSDQVINELQAILRDNNYYVSISETEEYTTFWRRIPMTKILIRVSW